VGPWAQVSYVRDQRPNPLLGTRGPVARGPVGPWAQVSYVLDQRPNPLLGTRGPVTRGPVGPWAESVAGARGPVTRGPVGRIRCWGSWASDSWARGPEARGPMLSVLQFSFSPQLLRVLLQRCHSLIPLTARLKGSSISSLG